MKIDKECKIEKAASTNETRRQLVNPYLDLKDKNKPVLVATSGRALAVIPVTLDEGDTQGYVSAAALKESRKKENKFNDSIMVNGNETVGRVSFVRPNEQDIGVFPNWRQIDIKAGAEKVLQLGIDTGLLADLAKALGSDGIVTLTFYRGSFHKGAEGAPKWVSGAIEVTTSKGRGLIMPCNV